MRARGLRLTLYKKCRIISFSERRSFFMNNNSYDVIIVGAGPGGIYAAYELCDKGLKIAVFEAGHPLNKRKCPIDGKNI